jgi:hypothetical protein
MIKNRVALAATVFCCGCHNVSAEIADRYQGVGEFDERVVAFELPGRLITVGAVRGGSVRTGEPLAAEVRAASGSRPS